MNTIVEIKPEDVLDSFSGGTEVLVTERQESLLSPGVKIRHENCVYRIESILQGRRKRLLLKLSKMQDKS